MARLLIGNSILDCHLLVHADKNNLKHSTYDLTIGRIFPVGEHSKCHRAQSEGELFFLEPRQSVLVISREEFQLPPTITGLATLRTTLTKNGLLALNVGIIDPFFNGPISTTLINFSDQKIPIKVGMPFFRVLFFEHADTSEFHARNESKLRSHYEEELTIAAHRDFPNLDNSRHLYDWS
jgi:deoxycytidine triphosphate deaminase